MIAFGAYPRWARLLRFGPGRRLVFDGHCGPYGGIVGEVLFLPATWARLPRVPLEDGWPWVCLSPLENNGVFVRNLTWVGQSGGV